jgi:hypothetical protein
VLLTPPAPSTAAEEAGDLFVEGCSGDEAELRAPANGFGVMLFVVELVHVPGIGDRAEDATAVQQRGSHSGQAIEESLGGLRAHRIPEETAGHFWRRLCARRTRQASSRSQSVAEFSQECSAKCASLVAGNGIGLAGADELHRLFDGELTAGVLSHFGEVHRFHGDFPFRSVVCS